MKPQVIRELSTKDLRERLDEEKRQLTRLKINHAVSPLDNPMRIRASRRDVARMTSELYRRETQEALKTDNK